MKATILGHEFVTPDCAEEIHRFRYQFNSDLSGQDKYISLRTAQVIIASLRGSNAFVRMLQEIVYTDSVSYDRLVGMTFDDRENDNDSNNSQTHR